MLDLFLQTPSAEATSPPLALAPAQPIPVRVGGAILVIEVDRMHREELRTALLAHGIAAIGTASELRALELLRHGELFDAVVVESGTGQESSFALLRQIRRQRRDIPIVALLSDDNPVVRMRACSEGASYCATQSTSMDTLAVTLRTTVERTRMMRLQGSSEIPAAMGTDQVGRTH